MDNLANNKKPFWIKRIYKSDHGTLIGLPKKLSEELKLNNETYIRMYYDSESQIILLKREPDVLERIKN
jgi:hypothetical protein